MQHTVSLKQNHEFRRLYNRGKSAVSPYFAIYCRKTGRDYSRLGITTGVKLGNAVKRNFVRRRIRALYRTNEAGLQPGYDIVVVARTRTRQNRQHWQSWRALLFVSAFIIQQGRAFRKQKYRTRR